MHNELHDGKALMDCIDCLIQCKIKTTIPRWIKWVDYSLTLAYLVGYVLIIVMIVRRFL